MKKTMITLLVLAISLAILFSYLALTKPKQMPFIGHFFDKVVYGSLYYFNKPDEAHIYASRGKIKLKLFVFNPLEKKSGLDFFYFLCLCRIFDYIKRIYFC